MIWTQVTEPGIVGLKVGQWVPVECRRVRSGEVALIYFTNAKDPKRAYRLRYVFDDEDWWTLCTVGNVGLDVQTYDYGDVTVVGVVHAEDVMPLPPHLPAIPPQESLSP